MIKVILDDRKYISGLTDEQSTLIKDDLMLENPAYRSAMKYSKYSSTRIPKYLTYFEEKRGSLLIPLAYKIPFEYEVEKDLRIEVTVLYPKIKVELRDSQAEACISYLNDPENGVISMPTGKGKSILGIYLAYTLRQKCLVIVHKDDLVSGWRKDIEMCFGGEVKSGLIKAKSRKVGDQITVATVQTLSRMSREELDIYTRQFGMLILDEMHHVGATSYDIVNKFSCPYKIGLSATPERSDGLDKIMNFYFGDFAYLYKRDENEKDILPVEVITQESGARYMPLVIRQGSRYRLADSTDSPDKVELIENIPYEDRPQIQYYTIEDVVMFQKKYREKYLNDIVREFKEGHSIVTFFNKKEHCRTLQALLHANGIPEEKIQMYYGDATEKKEDMINRAENERQLITIATYSIATEGTNVKQWEVAFLLSSINNEKNVEQVVGRIRRSAENKLKTVLVYDYRFSNVYTFKNHGKTRDRRYAKLGFKIRGRGVFTRGYK